MSPEAARVDRTFELPRPAVVLNYHHGRIYAVGAADARVTAYTLDGQQVVVRTKGAGAREREPGLELKGKINLNLATIADLDGLPGVGPALAQRIVERRQRSGPYETIEQLRDERILPAATYERVKELVAVD